MVAPLPIRGNDDAARIAQDVLARWQHIDAALSPIVGAMGVATLYRRCVFLASATYPWLLHDAGRSPQTLDLAPLRALLAGRESAEAAAAGKLLLETFTELIGRLIGASLAERILNPTPDSHSSGDAAQDLSP